MVIFGASARANSTALEPLPVRVVADGETPAIVSTGSGYGMSGKLRLVTKCPLPTLTITGVKLKGSWSATTTARLTELHGLDIEHGPASAPLAVT
jgi:hypothetical protein